MKSDNIQKQIDKFYEETGYRLEIKDGKPYWDSYLNLNNKKITKLPDNLIVGGSLYLEGTKIKKLPNNLIIGGCLNLEYSTITELPNNLVVGDYLCFYKSKITELPKNLVIGGSLDLRKTEIAKLPDNLVVGGSLYLNNTPITKLPNNLIVGDYLGLSDTKVTELPDNLIVGGTIDLKHASITKLLDNLVVKGCLDIEGTKIKKLPENLVVGSDLILCGTNINELPKNLAVRGVIFGMSSKPFSITLTNEARKKLQKARNFLQWNVGSKTYIKVDGIFSVVDSHKGNVWKTHQIGKDEVLYVVTDGEGHYAHGDTLRKAKADLIYKINDRDTSYKHLSLDSELSFEDAIAMYRTITGACAAGTRDFVESRLPKPHKKEYSIKEIIDLTDGEYGNERLKKFFNITNN